MKLDEIRQLGAQELEGRANELREEQFRLRFRSATETLEQPLRLREVRRDIARVLTVMREKELAAAKPAAKPAVKKPAVQSAAKSAAPKKSVAKRGARSTSAR